MVPSKRLRLKYMFNMIPGNCSRKVQDAAHWVLPADVYETAREQNTDIVETDEKAARKEELDFYCFPRTGS